MNSDTAINKRFGVRGLPRALAPQRWCPWCDGWGRVADGSMTGSTTDCYHCRGTGEDQEHARQAEQIAAVRELHQARVNPDGSRTDPWCEECDGVLPCYTLRALGVQA